MVPHQSTFRSKREREQESNLLKKYREIGIAAIAAASRAGRTGHTAANTQTQRRQANGRD